MCWGATVPIVVAGAPIGSMVLNKFRETMFRRLFYVLACIQFVTVGLVKVMKHVARRIGEVYNYIFKSINETMKIDIVNKLKIPLVV